MKFDTETAARYAAEKLTLVLERAERDSNEVTQQNDLPLAVKHFADLRAVQEHLSTLTAALKKHVDSLSYEILPTMFTNQNVKTIKLDEIGRVTVNVRWNASMHNKVEGMEWLRASGNEGLIIETVNAQTLGAFAKAETLAGRPLPDHLFKVGTAPFISITQD
jgi:glutamate mutase epsilon subunit